MLRASRHAQKMLANRLKTLWTGRRGPDDRLIGENVGAQHQSLGGGWTGSGFAKTRCEYYLIYVSNYYIEPKLPKSGKKNAWEFKSTHTKRENNRAKAWISCNFLKKYSGALIAFSTNLHSLTKSNFARVQLFQAIGLWTV